MISQQDDDRAQDKNDAAEMGRQLAAACKLIEKLKNQLVALSEEARQLRAKEASLAAYVATLEEQGGKAARPPDAGTAAAAVTGDDKEVSEAHRKVPAMANHNTSNRPSVCSMLEECLPC
jgi:septal ring factor EnvC (AmiA/AmiB activator)